MDYQNFDLIIVGAGPVGCILAERASRDMGWKCLIVEKRSHIAGNCYDFIHETGLLLHRYGPHLFRTDNPSLVDYLSAYTEWIPGNYRIKGFHRGELYPLPINLTTLEKFFRCSVTPESARLLLASERIEIKEPKNSEEYVLSKVGPKLYEAFYKGYTHKQWGVPARELLPSVCGRLPLRFNRDDRYVDESYQIMPKDGYTAMFERMLRHPFITVLLNTDFFEIRDCLNTDKPVIYTGPIDAYFHFCHGPLPWRSLDFEWVKMEKMFHQPCVCINYSSDHDYTRSVEIKHVTGQQHPGAVISYEYPHSRGEPFYPVLSEQNVVKYNLYRDLAEKENLEKGVYFCGRLATYSYLNMDKAMQSALELAQVLKKRYCHE